MRQRPVEVHGEWRSKREKKMRKVSNPRQSSPAVLLLFFGLIRHRSMAASRDTRNKGVKERKKEKEKNERRAKQRSEETRLKEKKEAGIIVPVPAIPPCLGVFSCEGG